MTTDATGLSEVWRYEPANAPDDGEAYMEKNNYGDWVSYTDYAVLAERLKALEEESELWEKASLVQLMKERDHLAAELATVTQKYQNLVAFYDQHVGTPCEQIRHEQEVVRLRAALEDCLFDLRAIKSRNQGGYIGDTKAVVRQIAALEAALTDPHV